MRQYRASRVGDADCVVVGARMWACADVTVGGGGVMAWRVQGICRPAFTSTARILNSPSPFHVRFCTRSMSSICIRQQALPSPRGDPPGPAMTPLRRRWRWRWRAGLWWHADVRRLGAWLALPAGPHLQRQACGERVERSGERVACSMAQRGWARGERGGGYRSAAGMRAGADDVPAVVGPLGPGAPATDGVRWRCRWRVRRRWRTSWWARPG